jgi:hypothetical protein
VKRKLAVAGMATTLAGAVVAAIVLIAPSASAATATFVKTSSWSTGYEAKFTVTNNTSTTITSWNVQFDLPAGSSMGSYWDALVSTSGQHVTATNRNWNGTLGPNASTSFGFIVAGTGDPANCTINGASCTGGGGPTAPGAPGNLRVTGTTSGSISLAWTAASGTVTGYRVYEGSAVRATVTGTAATISGLAANSTHTYAVRAYNSVGESAASNSVTATAGVIVDPPPATRMSAPYLYMGWGNPPAPGTVMQATGIRQFTMAFMLSGGGCTPAWDGNRALTGGADQQAINAIRAAGGEVQISFGGWSGNKLGPNCATPQALAGAYQQVINAYGLKYIDIDIENSDEFENEAVQDRILNALKIVKQNNPGITTIVTFGTSQTGPNYWGTRLINQARALGANIDNFTIMPFDFGCTGNMVTCTQGAAEGLKTALRTAFGWTDAQAYAHMGLSGMVGLSDQQELTTPAMWTQIRDYAKSRGIARLATWSVNRDRGCPGGGVQSACSGIDQSDWEFTRIMAAF